MGRVRTHRNDFFYFLSFSAFPNLFWLEKFPKWWFLVFLFFFAIFWNFLLRVRQDLIGTIFFFFCFLFFFPLFLGLPQLILAWKEATMVFFNFFLNFFATFFEFSITGWVGTHWNDFFCFFFFLSFSAFPNLFSLFLDLPQHILPRKEAIIVFSIFLEFSITGRVGTPRNDFFFFFSLSWPFPTYFGLKSCQNVGF